MRRIVLWIAAILITFTIGVGADRLWWRFMAAPPVPTAVEPAAFDVVVPLREAVYVPAPAPLPPPPPPIPNIILDSDDESYLSASFYIMGPKPKEFADIDSISIYLSGGVEDYPGEFHVNTVQGDDDDTYDNAAATFALVTDRKIFFATSKLENGDFEYRFEGEFLRKDFDAVSGKKKAVLRGTLTKTKNGRTVAQHEFTFWMEHAEGC